MTAYVLDASVAAKWVLPRAGETLVEEAEVLLDLFARGKVGLSVPDLFWAEVGNVLWKAARAGRMSEAAARRSMDVLLGLGLPSVPVAGLAADALAVAMAFERTVYDALYVALAVSTRRTLVTADERLAHALAAHLPVRWLGSL